MRGDPCEAWAHEQCRTREDCRGAQPREEAGTPGRSEAWRDTYQRWKVPCEAERARLQGDRVAHLLQKLLLVVVADIGRQHSGWRKCVVEHERL